MTINIIVLKGDLDGKIVVVRFFFLSGICLEDDSISLLLGDQSPRFRHLCMSGLHKIWSKVN